MDVRDAIRKLRGTQSSNQLTMLVCKELEERLTAKTGVRGGYQPPDGGTKPRLPTTGSGVSCPVCAARRQAKALAQQRWRKKQRKGR